MSVVYAMTVGLEAGKAAETDRGNLQDFVQFRASRDGSLHQSFGGRRIAHQPDEDFGAGFIGNHVGRASAGEGADVQRARPQDVDRRAA